MGMPQGIIKVEGYHARKLSVEKSNYIDACKNFHEIVINTLVSLGFVVPRLKKGASYPVEWQLLFEKIGTRYEAKRFKNFLRNEVNITPREKLYFTICDELGISPDEAGFEYYLV